MRIAFASTTTAPEWRVGARLSWRYLSTIHFLRRILTLHNYAPRSGAVVRLNAVGDCGHDRARTICLTSSAAAGGRRRRAALFFPGAPPKPITSHGLGL
jgi:hypothetical protein